jgi:hypothetical protein
MTREHLILLGSTTQGKSCSFTAKIFWCSIYPPHSDEVPGGLAPPWPIRWDRPLGAATASVLEIYGHAWRAFLAG